MKRNAKAVLLTLYSIVAGGALSLSARQIGDVPAIPIHMKEADIESGRVSFEDVQSQELFGIDTNADGDGVLSELTVDRAGTAASPRTDASGGASVRAYTDLKRHTLCDDRDQFFCNERSVHDGIAPSTFLTRKLWDVGSSAAFGRRGDLSTLTEAIEHYAGEARPSLTNLFNLPAYGRAAIVEFLKTLQVALTGADSSTN